MTKLGEIRKGTPGYKRLTNKFIYHACEVCGHKRWVELINGIPRSLMCKQCACKHMRSFITEESRKKSAEAHRGKQTSDYQKRRASEANTTHGNCCGYKKTTLYTKWAQMMQRCFNENHRQYDRYGGRDIYVTPEWFDFTVFRDWCYATGWKKGLSIDRIDNDNYYEPSNCQWLTVSDHSKKTRKEQRERVLCG